jgi:hypothetical protein
MSQLTLDLVRPKTTRVAFYFKAAMYKKAIEGFSKVLKKLVEDMLHIDDQDNAEFYEVTSSAQINSIVCSLVVSQGGGVYHAFCLDIPVDKGINATAIRERFKNIASSEKVSDLFEYNYS